jgi:hypothetical protein
MTDNIEDKKDEAPIVVAEQQDGTVVVEGMSMPEGSEDRVEESAQGGQVHEDEHEDQPGDTEAIRAARREKRKLKKQYHRQVQQEKDLKYQQLTRQNQELMERLSAVEQKTHGSELARIDKAIEDSHVRIQYAKMKMGEAAGQGDGQAMADAQEAWFEARRAAEELEGLKKRSVEPKQNRPIAPDVRVQKNAAQWMERNPWYDPNQKDIDSKIALIIDKEMAGEGWDAGDDDYWEELDNRLQDRIPHRYNSNNESKSSSKRPRSVVVGSGRESASGSGMKNSYVLTKERVDAIKEAGMWDDDKARKRMINRYIQQDLQNRS